MTLLKRLDHEVVFPQGQTGCGQMHLNTGYLRQALPMVRPHVDVFSGCDVVGAPSGSGAGSLRHQDGMVARTAGNSALAARAEQAAAKTYGCPNCWSTCSA